MFDNIAHERRGEALRHYCDDQWVPLLVQPWLMAPMQSKEGSQHERTVGVLQGAALSPVLANLFLHCALEHGFDRHHPQVPFYRCGKKSVVGHCAVKVMPVLKTWPMSAAQLYVDELLLSISSISVLGSSEPPGCCVEVYKLRQARFLVGHAALRCTVTRATIDQVTP